ncbi:hypothetical protein LCGC14_1654790 [marine sediment metagenome]|uniref:Uncharacterized protein n=1 Tax=marine sediment metagenome TaxID=412755 RepID=A0A0F9IIF8_9ZZZZ
MDADKNSSYEILYMLDRISEKFTKEIENLKKKLKLYENKPELRQCSLKFYKETLAPLFEQKEFISLSDISKNTTKKRNIIQNYISELSKYKFVNKIKNEEGDKRTKLLEKMI